MTPKQVAELEERLKVAKAQLKAKEQQIAARKRTAEGKAARILETRKKILIGAAMLDRMKKQPETQDEVMRMLDDFLTRNIERKIFDLPSIKEAVVPNYLT